MCAVNVAEFFAGVPPVDRPYWTAVLSTLTYWAISPAVARRAGELRYDFARQGHTLAAVSATDTLIAAVALEEGATLVTGNPRHYPLQGIRLLTL